MKTATVLLMLAAGALAHAQIAIGISGGYTYIPYSEFSDDDAPDGVKLQVDSWQGGVAFPLAFADGKTVILNNLTYDLIGIDYDDPLGSVAENIRQLHSLTFTLLLIQQLSETWQLLAAVTPGLVSDLEGELSTDDFSVTALLGARHDFSDRFSLGAGLAYQRDFGDPLPLPFVLVEWVITPRLALSALLPRQATLLYSPWEVLDVGLFAEVEGNQYQGDPDTFGVDNPLVKYSVISAGPVVRIHITRWTHVELKGGTTLRRRLEFYDGEDKAETFNLKNAWFVQGGVQLGR
jgi:hypothetical protein